MNLRSLLLVAFAVTALPVVACAQGVQLNVSAGVAQIDGSGVHTTSTVHVSAEHQLYQPWARLQARLSVTQPVEDYIGKRTYLIPELVVQAQRSIQSVQPFVNLGFGAARSSAKVLTPHTTLSLSAGAGIRAALHGQFGGQLEARARSIGAGFGGSMTELTAGFSWRL